MLTLRYAVNGLRFGRVYPRRDWRRCIERARMLRSYGIGVILKRGRA